MSVRAEHERAPRLLERRTGQAAIVDFVERVTPRAARTTFRRPSASPCSTTTGRSGARSRCRSSSASSSAPRGDGRGRRALRERQPWKAAYEHDYGWLGGAMTKHYHGDDSDVKLLIGGVIQAFAGWTVEDYDGAAGAFLRAHASDPRPPVRRCGYLPMVELLRFLEANGFTVYIASGGDRDFMRAVTEEIYGIPPERVIGSSNALRFTGGRRRRLDRLPRRARRLRRRPGQAGADLEPHRPPPDPRGGQLERRHPDAPVRRRGGPAGAAPARLPRRRRARVRTTPAAPSRHSTRRAPRAGRSSASRTTGRRCSRTLRADGVVEARSMGRARRARRARAVLRTRARHAREPQLDARRARARRRARRACRGPGRRGRRSREQLEHHAPRRRLGGGDQREQRGPSTVDRVARRRAAPSMRDDEHAGRRRPSRDGVSARPQAPVAGSRARTPTGGRLEPLRSARRATSPAAIRSPGRTPSTSTPPSATSASTIALRRSRAKRRSSATSEEPGDGDDDDRSERRLRQVLEQRREERAREQDRARRRRPRRAGTAPPGLLGGRGLARAARLDEARRQRRRGGSSRRARRARGSASTA